MADSNSNPPNPPEPELELDRPVKPVSNPRMQVVRSAARPDAPTGNEPRKKLTSTALKAGAVDTLLNSVSILGEVVEDFRSQDRFFKYKALVLTTWALLTIGAFGVACPTTGPSNNINARLVVSGEAGNPIYMVKNESPDSWQDVEIIVNGEYRSTMSQIEPNGGNVTLSPAVIFDANGNRAPSKLRIVDIEVRVREPEENVVLLRGGTPQHQ